MLKNKPDSKGFTLVEVLVALAVFSGLMMTLFSSFNAFTASSRMIRDYEKKSRDAGPGLDTLVSDLEQVFALQPPRLMETGTEDAQSQEKFRFAAAIDQIDGRAFSRLEFTSLSPVQFRSSPDRPLGITGLVYYVSAHGERMDLHRSDTPIHFPDRDQPSPCTDPVVVKDIESFDLTFIDIEGEGHDRWDSRDEELDYGLPARVGIAITLGRHQGSRKISTQVAIPVRVEK
ncbi:MAG: prepilin-type N-terminal cleavage/methylation domain-containing protein [Desulfobacter sp.]|nr:MAG: prepilin-type N-terminal cleavage/methylation domain-containing protein [Desulfobacter sp.]